MKQPRVVIDSSAIILLAKTPLSGPPAPPPPSATEEQRVAWAHVLKNSLHKDDAVIVVPTPVYAELHTVQTPAALRKIVGTFLTYSCTAAVGQVAATMLQGSKGKTQAGRQCVKYDALIAATAHVLKADILFCDNFRDFQPLLDAVASPVEILGVTGGAQAIPKNFQTNLLGTLAPPPSPKPAPKPGTP